MMDYAKAFMKVYAKVCDLESDCKVNAADNRANDEWSDAKDCESQAKCYGRIREEMEDILSSE